MLMQMMLTAAFVQPSFPSGGPAAACFDFWFQLHTLGYLFQLFVPWPPSPGLILGALAPRAEYAIVYSLAVGSALG